MLGSGRNEYGGYGDVDVDDDRYEPVCMCVDGFT